MTTETVVRAESASAAPDAEPGRSRVTIGRLRTLALVPAIVALLIAGTFVDPVFLTRDNLVNVLQQQTELSLLVLGEALILISGKFDLSLESTIGLAPALAIALVVPASSQGLATHGLGTDWPSALAIPLCLLVGVTIGAINGLMILKLRLNAFIVTLGMLITLRGLQIGITGGSSLFTIPSSFLYLGSAQWLGFPASIWIAGIAFALGMTVLRYLRHGRALYAIGGNTDAARAAGIRTDRVVWVTLIVGSLLAATAGMLMTGRLGGVAASQGQGMIFTVFAAAVIGGISLDGGKGTLFGALCGVLVLGLIQNILTLAHVSGQWFQAINGVIILIALMLSRVTTGQAQD